MRMKRMVSFLLVLVMLLGLFAGCGQQGGETKPGTESQAGQETTQVPTEPEVKDPPRTAEDFIAQLSDAMQDRNIPIDLVLEWDDDYSQDIRYTGYSVRLINGDGNYGELRIVLYYSKTEPGTLSNIEIIRYDAANEQEQEAYPVLSGIASALCDEAMTEVMAAELFAAEPAQSWYATYSGDIGSFSEIREIPYPEGVEHTDSSVVFRQPGKLTHSILREHITFQKETRDLTTYEITFAGTEECFFADKISSIAVPSVEELEQRINDAFVALGVPITCTLAPYENYGLWHGVFRWTTLEKEGYAYPEYPYEEWGQTPEEVEDERVAQYIRESIHWVDLDVFASDPIRKNAPVYDVQFRETEAIPELEEVICIACDPENGEAALSALQGLELVESNDREGYRERTLQKDDYRIFQLVDTDPEYGYVGYQIYYEDTSSWYVSEPSGEALLDPALLDYEFQLEEPMVVDGLFNYYDQSYETYFQGSGEYFDLGALLNDFLKYTRSHLYVEYYWDNGEHYCIHAGGWGDVLNSSVFRIDQYDVAIEFYYNVNIQDYLDGDWRDSLGSEYILRIPIGISLLMDESMTVEEAIRLHTHATEYDFIATAEDQEAGIAEKGFQVTVYGTGDVVHLLTENPKTGENSYSVILREYVEYDSDYSRLIQYLND